MEYFDMRKMSVNLWRMLPVKRAKFALSHRQNVIFMACQHCIHRGEWGVFFVSRYERIVTLLEGGEMFLESADRLTIP